MQAQTARGARSVRRRGHLGERGGQKKGGLDRVLDLVEIDLVEIDSVEERGHAACRNARRAGRRGEDAMQNAKPIAALALIVLVIVWAIQNRAPVTTQFLFVTVRMPQAVLLSITLLAGAAIGLLFALGRGARRGKR